MYTVGIFTETNEVEHVPLKWICNKNDQKNIKDLAANHTEVQCYWPPYKKKSSILTARKKCTEAEVGWAGYKMKVIGVAGLYCVLYSSYMHILLFFYV
jgi:hypothetical protein